MNSGPVLSVIVSRPIRSMKKPDRRNDITPPSGPLWQDGWRQWLDALRYPDWQPVSGWQLLAVVGGCVLMLLLRKWSGQDWVFLLDNANLALHEAGHPLVGLFSERLTVYGGTLFQLLFPVLLVIHFIREGYPAGVSVAVIWLGENLLNIARYMADARAQVLPLVGGGEHDWTEIFSRWGVLQHDLRIALWTRLLGYSLMLAALFWLWLRYQTEDSEG